MSVILLYIADTKFEQLSHQIAAGEIVHTITETKKVGFERKLYGESKHRGIAPITEITET